MKHSRLSFTRQQPKPLNAKGLANLIKGMNCKKIKATVLKTGSGKRIVRITDTATNQTTQFSLSKSQYEALYPHIELQTKCHPDVQTVPLRRYKGGFSEKRRRSIHRFAPAKRPVVYSVIQRPIKTPVPVESDQEG